MSADLDTPYDQVLIWAFNFACDTLEPLDARFPQIGIGRKQVLFGDVYQAAVIVATLLQIEQFLGKHDYTRLHAGITENIDQSVRSRYLASIQDLCRFLSEPPSGTSETDTIPPLDRLSEQSANHIESAVGVWITSRLIGREPKFDYELRFASAVGKLVYSENALFIAAIFLSDGKRIDRDL
jgi:hypothetical protein